MNKVASVEVVAVHYYYDNVLDTKSLMKSFLRENLDILIEAPWLKWRLKGVTRAVL